MAKEESKPKIADIMKMTNKSSNTTSQAKSYDADKIGVSINQFTGKKFQSLTQAELERKKLALSSIVEQSKGILNHLEEKEPAPKPAGADKHHDEVVALDKNYEEKSHKFAEKFLQNHPKKQQPPTFFAGVLDSSKQLFAQKKDKTSSVADMLGTIDSLSDVDTVSNDFLGKLSEIKSAVEDNPAEK